MMIEVERLSKRYGDIHAIQDVSFSVAQGDVLGFLGPNGAGKSTTMRIIVGALGASSGRVTVNGVDVADDPRAVQAMIGYAPETPPVYGNMTVHDYVAFAASLKGVDAVEKATQVALDRVGLTGVSGRLIDHLSKGYRQRVGLAQALVHDPKVLILDEPTSGLDPAQRIEIRNLIRELAEGERTVVLSTHVLAEIEAICNRVVFINRGKVVAQEDRSQLGAAGRLVRLTLARPDEAAHAALRAVGGVDSVEVIGEDVVVRGSVDLRERLAQAAAPWGLLELSGRKRLEDRYLEVVRTGE